MRIRVLGGTGGGFLSDVKVFLVGEKGSKAAAVLSSVFPTTAEGRSDGSVAYAIQPGAAATPKLVDAVEIESPTLTALLVGVAVLIVGLVVALIVKK